VRGAKYLRQQAELCLEIASQLSDPAAAQRVRLNAADFFAQADALERHSEQSASTQAQARGPKV
jgi:hypothetical protein